MTIINGETRLVGLLGWPAKYTLSPAMQNPAIEALGLNWVYVPLPVPPERLGEAVAGARALGFIGVNATIPHKQAIIAFLDDVEPTARALGAVNTVHFTERGAIGYNTDIDGFRRTVEAEGAFDFAGRTVLQIGAGGAGRAMAAGAAAAGARRIHLHDVDPERTARLVDDLKAQYRAVEFRILKRPEDLRAVAAEADLIANATPLGMKPEDPLPLDAELIEPRHLVFDAVYIPSETALLRAAAARGARTVRGAGMLARQGARSLEIWSGRRPNEDLMLRKLKEKLGID